MFDKVSHCEKSDIGLLRHNNEDSYRVVDRDCAHYDLEKFGLLFVIADGLGGHAAGEIASRMACEEAVAAYYTGDAADQESRDTSLSPVRRLEKTLWSAHQKIVDMAKARDEWRGMGTTLSALALSGDHALIAHVGDSRIYRFRNRSCERMTIDHTENQRLISIGKIPADDDGNHCGRHIITQALGGGGALSSVYTRVESLRSGDVFLLCTDGLHDLVADREIEKILEAHPLPDAACDALVQAAIQKGGHDNVTVVVIHTEKVSRDRS